MFVQRPLRSLLGILAATALTTVGLLVVGTSSTSAAPECVESVFVCGFTVPATAGGPVANGGTGPFGTGIVLGPGKVAAISGPIGGSVFLGGNNPPVGPDGGIGPAPNTALVPGALYGCLAARVGTAPWSCVGSGTTFSGDGELQFGVNDDPEGNAGNGYGDNTGAFDVPVQLSRGWVTFEKVLVGDDPGIAFPMVVTCTGNSNPHGPATESGVGNQLVVAPDQTATTTMLLRPNEPQTFEVWWAPPALGARCDWAEDLSTVPPPFSCTAEFPSTFFSTGFLFDSHHQKGGTVTVTNTCTAAPISEPNFTG